MNELSLWSKLRSLDLVGCSLLISGLALFLTGTGLGGGLYSWTDVHTLATLVVGIVTLIAFGVYEWKGTKTGILNHDLFRGGRDQGQTFALCVSLIALEAIMIFGYALFFPVL